MAAGRDAVLVHDALREPSDVDPLPWCRLRRRVVRVRSGDRHRRGLLRGGAHPVPPDGERDAELMVAPLRCRPPPVLLVIVSIGLEFMPFAGEESCPPRTRSSTTSRRRQ